MTCFYLKKLLKVLNLAIPRPSTELQLMRALVQYQLGDRYTEARLQEILERRGKAQKAHSFVENLSSAAVKSN